MAMTLKENDFTRSIGLPAYYYIVIASLSRLLDVLLNLCTVSLNKYCNTLRHFSGGTYRLCYLLNGTPHYLQPWKRYG